jgi:hypothetical protein
VTGDQDPDGVACPPADATDGQVIDVVRRMVARVAAGFAAAVVATGLAVALTPAPASADDDRVQVRAPRDFDAGESAESVTIGIAKRTKGCVSPRTQLGISLPGLTAGQVVVQVQKDRQWQGVGLSDAGDGTVVTGQTVPDREVLCQKQSAGVRYRVVFAGDVRSGTATFVGEAFTARGELIGRDTATSRIDGGRPSPTPRKTTSSPTPSPTEALDTGGPVDGVLATVTDPAAFAAPGAADDGGFGPGTLIMIGGVGLVGVGAALLVFLFLRARSERQEDEIAAAPTAVLPLRPGAVPDSAPTVIMPRLDEP